MATQQNVLKVFLASPGNLEHERVTVGKVIETFNRTWSNWSDINTKLELIKWETHTYPSMGSDAQAVINRQIGNYDIFIGILSDRFGTPTPRAGSGTEEEFLLALSKHNDPAHPVEIMFYFKKVNNSNISDQQSKVLAFKEKFHNNQYPGLYWEYESIADFEESLRGHLSRAVQYWIKNNILDNSQQQAQNKSVNLMTYSEFIKTQQDYENIDIHGTIDLMHTSSANKEVWHLIQFVMENIQEQQQIVANIINDTIRLTDSYKILTNNSPINQLEKVKINTREIALFVEKLRSYIPTFLNGHNMTMSKLNDLASSRVFYAGIHFDQTGILKLVSNYYGKLAEMIDSIERMHLSFQELADSINGETETLWKVSRDAVFTLKTISFIFKLSVEQSKDIENILQTNLQNQDLE